MHEMCACVCDVCVMREVCICVCVLWRRNHAELLKNILHVAHVADQTRCNKRQ